MKRLCVIMMALLLLSCNQSSFEYVLPEGTYLEDIQEDYTQKLIDSEHGWYMNYKFDKISFNILIRFKENGLCDILSDVDGYNFLDKDVRYKLAGLVHPELQITSYSAFQKLYEFFPGSFEFVISENEDGTFKLKPVTGNTASILLTEASSTQYEMVESHGEVIDIVNDFSQNATAYFKNFEADGVSAFLDLNLGARSIMFSWVDANDKVVNEERIFNYKIGGITLDAPVTINNKSFSYLNFGQYNTDELEVVDDNGGHIGRIYVSHVASIVFPHTADAYLYYGKPVQFWAYVGDNLELNYSPDLRVKWREVMDVISPTMFRIQVYNNAASGESIQFLCRPDGATSTWLRYNVKNYKMGEDHVFVDVLGTHNTGLADQYKDLCYELLHLMFPPEGVTIMPYGRFGNGEQQFRIISRQNSRIYFTIRVGAGAPLDYSWD